MGALLKESSFAAVRSNIKNWLAAVLGFLVYRLLSCTWRCTYLESPKYLDAKKNGQLIVLAHWHGDELGLISAIKRYRICAMVSTSKDGEIMNLVIKLLGGVTSRGSSTRGGVSALKGLLRNARAGYNPSVAVDGPKGPIYKVKPGVFEISKIVKAQIYPIVIEASSKWFFSRAWNKTFLPKPFARIVFYCADPLPLLDPSEDPRSNEVQERLEAALNNAKRHAHRHMIAGSPSPC